MRQCRIAETFDQSILIRRYIDTTRQRKRRYGLVSHEPAHETNKLMLRGDLIDELVASQIAEISQRRMARVEKPQLHRFERRDIVDQLGACAVPRRAAGDEVILDSPLDEGLMNHRRGIVQSERAVI